MVRPTRLNLLLYLVYSLLVAGSATFLAAAHSPHFILLSVFYLGVLLIPVGGALFFARSARIRSVLANRTLWFLCICLFTAFDETRYWMRLRPHPEKSSAAPALMEPAQNLLHGKDPYAVRLPDGAPVSPGPGWIFLLAPITLPGGAGLLTGLSTFLVAWLLRDRSPVGSGLFVLLILLQPVLIDNSIWGTDLFAIPIVYAALCLLAERWSAKPAPLLLLGVIAGLFAQSRLPMAALLFLLGLGLWRRSRSDARTLMFPASIVLVVFYAVAWLWTGHDHIWFQPLHVLHRERASGILPSLAGLVGAGLVLVWVLFRMKGCAQQWILAGALLLVAAFVPTGLGELSPIWPHMERWEGANYVSFSMSLLAAYLALDVTGRQGPRETS